MIPDARAFESRYAPDQARSRHEHAFGYLCYIAAGSMEERDRRGRRHWGGGDVVAYPEGYDHASSFGPIGCHLFHVRIDPEVRLDLVGATDCAQLAGPMIRAHRERSCDDPDADLARSSWVQEAIARLVGARQRPGIGVDRLERIRERLATDLGMPLSLGELAQQEEIDPSHLGRAFRLRYGLSPGDFRRSVRVSRAARALASTTRPLAELALDLGFHDQAHFTRVFRHWTGVTPGRYRGESS